jgi:hypothetical protein
MRSLSATALFALALTGVVSGVAPGKASAMSCECSAQGTLVPQETSGLGVPQESCDAVERCDSIEDCASLLPFSFVARRVAEPSLAPSAGLAWCERATDPECSEAPPVPERVSGTLAHLVAALPRPFPVPSRDGPVIRSTSMSKTIARLAGIDPARGVDRPPR